MTQAEAIAMVAREWATGPRSHEPLLLQPGADGTVTAQIGMKSSYTVSEAAECMGVSRATFHRKYLKTGLVTKRGGRIPAGQLMRIRKRNLE